MSADDASKSTPTDACLWIRAKLENTILSRSTIVEHRAQLKDCELAPGYATQPEGERFCSLPMMMPCFLISACVSVAVSLKGERLSTW